MSENQEGRRRPTAHGAAGDGSLSAAAEVARERVAKAQDVAEYPGPRRSDATSQAFEERLENARLEAQWYRNRRRRQPARFEDIATRHQVPIADLKALFRPAN